MIVEERTSSKRKQASLAPPAPEQSLDQAKQLITDHPLIVVGAALAVGALVGLLRARSGEKKGMLRGLVGGLAMALIREAVLDRVSSYANGWIDTKSREEAASRSETVNVLEH